MKLPITPVTVIWNIRCYFKLGRDLKKYAHTSFYINMLHQLMFGNFEIF